MVVGWHPTGRYALSVHVRSVVYFQYSLRDVSSRTKVDGIDY